MTANGSPMTDESPRGAQPPPQPRPSVEEAPPVSAVSPRVLQRSAASVEAAPTRRARLDRYHDHPELHIESDRVARTISGLIAAFIVAGLVLWMDAARDQWNVIELVRPWWVRLPQLLLGVVGIVVAAVEAAYLGYYAATGRVWRRWLGVTLLFAAVTGAWTLLYLVDYFLLDHIFVN